MIKAPQSKQAVENGLLSFYYCPPNAALIPAVMECAWNRQTPTRVGAGRGAGGGTTSHERVHKKGHTQMYEYMCLYAQLRFSARNNMFIRTTDEMTHVTYWLKHLYFFVLFYAFVFSLFNENCSSCQVLCCCLDKPPPLPLG